MTITNTLISSGSDVTLFLWFCVCLRSSTMGQVYAEHRDEDGFLYVAYSGENTFGHGVGAGCCCCYDDV